MTKFYDVAGGRKFFAVLLTMLLTTVLLWFGKLTDSSFATIWLGVVVGFMGTNAYEAVKGTASPNADR
jgi:hypothetical protein